MILSMYLPKDWVDDREDGDYWHECEKCRTMFLGNINRTVCKLCDTKEASDGK